MKNTPLRKHRPAHPSKNPYKRRSAELIPVAFDKVPNNYARLFSNIGGFAGNVYDVYQNINE